MLKKLSFLKILNSPFKSFNVKWYFGKLSIGTPYFLPRRWVQHPTKKGYLTAIPKKIGFDFVGLGYKTKWNDTDYRFEWSPLISFVFFKWQVAVIFSAPINDSDYAYWEGWLYYENNTDKTKSKKERIENCMEKFPLTYTIKKGKKTTKIDYYNLILKKQYIK